MDEVIIFGITKDDTVYILDLVIFIAIILITIIRHDEEIHIFVETYKEKIRTELNHINEMTNDDYMNLLNQDFENNTIYF